MMNERPNKKPTQPTHNSMKEILEKVLTEKDARDERAITALAASQEEFDIWD
jgi:hypothetical protein